MRTLAALVLVILLVAPAFAGRRSSSPRPRRTAPVRVKGYMKKSGTYVQPHYKTAPNKTKRDNYGTKGNMNPYTGKEGSREADK